MTDALYFDAEPGDLVLAGIGDDELDAAVELCITSIEPRENGLKEVSLVPLDVDAEVVWVPMYKCLLEVGENFTLWPGSSRWQYNLDDGSVRDCNRSNQKPPKVTGELIGLRNGLGADIQAKYEAYLDPSVAALCEVPGRLTRNRHYSIA